MARVTRRSFRAAPRWRAAAVALALAALPAACAPGFRRDESVRLPELWRPVPVDAVPVLLPPASPPMLGARSRAIGEIFRSYHIVLANPTVLPHENRLDMDVEWLAPGILSALDRPQKPYPVPLYTLERLNETLETEFPGLEPRIGDGGMTRYGVYDYAYATDGTTVCVLAWQLITDREKVLPETLDSIRLEWRMCGPGYEPASLLAPFEGLRLTVDPGILELSAFGG